jgi:ribosomal protein S18 acetylase RimI-like enzyme
MIWMGALMVAHAIKHSSVASGLRLMDPMRDLQQVADLIEESFLDEIGPAGMAAVRELRLMARSGALVWLMSRMAAESGDAFTGFVWVEDGQVVGNVTVNEPKPRSRRWHISNVAVKPAYRDRGIGRRLVEAALELARAHAGEWAILQVRHNNQAALRIYQRLGFEQLFATVELVRQGLWGRSYEPFSLSSYRLTPSRPDDWRRQYDLALLTTSPQEQWVRGLELSEFRYSRWRQLREWLSDLPAGGHAWRLCLELGQELVGTLIVRSRGWGQSNHLAFSVHPGSRGSVEGALVRQGLALLGSRLEQDTFVEHSADHVAGIQALKESGFVEKRTLVTMRRSL